MFNNFDLLNIILTIPAILVGFTFHEYAHAAVADRLGDKTPRFQGRLTFNPMAHIDIVGFIMILIVGFGWAKPVQTNPSAYKRYYKDDLKVSVAGPIANMLVAIIFTAVFAGYYHLLMNKIPGEEVPVIIANILLKIISINIMLFLFNLLPLPGLDGYHVLRDLSPSTFYKYSNSIERYQMFILLIFVATPISTYIIGKPAGWIFYKLISLTGVFL